MKFHIQILLLNFLTFLTFVEITRGEVVDDKYYKVKNNQNHHFLTVDETIRGTYLAGVVTNCFDGNGTQVWKTTLINKTENVFWLFPIMYPLNIVSAYKGPPFPYPISNLLEFKLLKPYPKEAYLIKSTNRKACLDLDERNGKVLVNYKDCNETIASQVWEMELYDIEQGINDKVKDQMMC